MACYHPIYGWKARHTTANKKRPIAFDRGQGYSDMPVTLPCGKCVGCLLERSRMWAIRCYHESQLWDDNVFVTLTYSTVPEGGSLRPRDFVLFMKRLREARREKEKKEKKKYGPIRFLQAGEYGDLGRPHHHAILFNCGFDDGEILRQTDAGENIYTSEKLSKAWKLGYCSFGEVTFESAAYVARYNVKKLGEKELNGRHAEYITMSRRPGIGGDWIKKYATDVYPFDEVTIRGGKVCRPPRYYDDQVEVNRPDLMEDKKARRFAIGEKWKGEREPQRRKSKEKVALARLAMLRREL